jgi:hypothetical protein
MMTSRITINLKKSISYNIGKIIDMEINGTEMTVIYIYTYPHIHISIYLYAHIYWSMDFGQMFKKIQ